MVKVKNKKRNLAETTAKKRDQSKKKSLNAFEVHINKEKHKVLGRKNKADRGLPGVARAKAINKRKNTLLHEYKVKDKSNTFVDRRIGEKNSAMTQEDKVMARFAAEKMKAHKKKNIFNLNDEELLTHRGQTLAEIEKYDDPRSDDDEYSDEENKTGKLDKDFVSEAHFGGGLLSKSDSSMSRKDLIEQLIAESKKRKAEKQKVREQTLDLTDKLDSEWKDLLPIVNASKKRVEEPYEKTKVDDYDIALRELKFEARGTPSDRLKSEEEIAKEEKEKLETLEADRLARMKGSAGNADNAAKHKSADDLDDGFVVEDINEEALTYGEDGVVNGISKEKDDENLEDNNENKSVEESESRESSEDENTMSEDLINDLAHVQTLEEKLKTDTELVPNNGNQIQHKSKDPYDNIPVLKISDDNEVTKAKVNKHQRISDDADLLKKNDNRAATSTKISKSPITAESSGNGVEDKSSESDIESEAEENSDDNDSDEDNLSDLKMDESSSEEDTPLLMKNVNFSTNVTQKVMPYSKPTSTPLKSILKTVNNESSKVEKLSAEERTALIIADLLKRKEMMEKAREELPYTYAAPESIEELQKLLQHQNADYQSVIVERIIKCNHQSLAESNKEKLAKLFAYLLQHVNECMMNAEDRDIGNSFQIFDRLCPHLYDLTHALPGNAKTCIQEIMKEKHDTFELHQKKYPDLDTLILFKLVSLLFPTSDYRHPVVTPAIVFMSEILTRCHVRSRSDISKGLFICTLVLEYTLLSKRFSPSVINFLRGVIHMSTPKPSVQVIKTIPPFKCIGELSNLLVVDTDQTKFKINPESNLMLATDLNENEIDDNFKIRTFVTAVNLVSEFKTQLEELDAAYPIFEPIIKLLSINKMSNYPENVKQRVRCILKDLNTLKDKKLEYITREKKKPKALRLYEPRIETVYDGRRHKPMSKEKAEREKLLHKYKREVKGAIREVRRDTAFLAKVQIKQQIKSDQDRKRKVKEIFGDAALQQGELNKIKRSK
ncbi:nucleolar protein 14 [Neodiprion virginianus]|uniref:nucleolar protein 14 n=1 Tax=Neodiprion virginianus TaxID=2961670 RepID=UPI001EE6AE38|nr:nucleolar protein 14 [Neodiprion virginianus]XP_046609594.1 nucleolar protein 14 [Neodiprion virginianus]